MWALIRDDRLFRPLNLSNHHLCRAQNFWMIECPRENQCRDLNALESFSPRRRKRLNSGASAVKNVPRSKRMSPTESATRCATSPPISSASADSKRVRVSVRRAYVGSQSASDSAKVLRTHTGFAQRNRLTINMSRTVRPMLAISWGRRVYQPCTRRDSCLHFGHVA